MKKYTINEPRYFGDINPMEYYLAFDGSAFDDEIECDEWERALSLCLQACNGDISEAIELAEVSIWGN